MTFGQVLLEALRAMAMNRLRTALTMLGMIIGVGAVVLMMAVGQGAQTKVNQSISSMGSNLFIVLSGAVTSGGLRFGTGSAQTLTVDDAAAIARLPTVSGTAPLISGGFQLGYGNANWGTLVWGTTPDYFTLRAWDTEEGELFGETDLRSGSRVAVIGQTVAENLFPDESPVGKT
ncbi:MAG: ABC transporter permease, partial [Burkholderiales bacterium]